MAKRITCSIVLILALALSSNIARAVTLQSSNSPGGEISLQGLQAGRLENNANEGLFRSFGVSETPTLMQVNPRQNERFSPDPVNSPRLVPPLPPLAAQLTPASARLHKLFEPGNLPDRVLRQACGYLATPYRRGGSLQSGHGTDCSGFVQYIYKKSNIDLPRASSEQARVGKVVARSMDFSKLLEGDLLFFRRGGRHIGHVGIYLGEGKMIHASSRRYGVIISDLHRPYYQDTFVVAKRVF
jgi:cell wall-associated NlpC family hydrolase